MRHTYELTEQTIKAVNGHAQDVADEMDVSDKYVYAILSGSQTDPFAPFLHFFRAAIKAGCDVSHWMNRLEGVKRKHEMRSGELCIDSEMAKAIKESADVPAARLNGKPLYTQLTEVCESIAQKEILKQAIMDAINKERDEENSTRSRFGGKEVSFDTRNRVRSISR